MTTTTRARASRTHGLVQRRRTRAAHEARPATPATREAVTTSAPAAALAPARAPAAPSLAQPGVSSGQAAVLRLQRSYGNQAVQRLVGGAPTGPAVQRWHDQEHMDSTRDGLAGIDMNRMVQLFSPQYPTPASISNRLADASVNMDRFVPHPFDTTRESHNVGRLGSGVAFLGSTVFGAARRGISGLFGGTGQPAAGGRGVVGEGPDHGEAGKYYTPPGTSAPANKAREDHYITLAVNALGAGDIDFALNKLGDAAHVSADRGSHGEGDRGRGHDTPTPPPGVTGTQMPNYMEKFDDCDNRALNPGGYAYGVARTNEMFARFMARVPAPQVPAPIQQNNQNNGQNQGQG